MKKNSKFFIKINEINEINYIFLLKNIYLVTDEGGREPIKMFSHSSDTICLDYLEVIIIISKSTLKIFSFYYLFYNLFYYLFF